jgi:hypothetical protein
MKDAQMIYGACFWVGMLLLIVGFFASTSLAVGGGLVAAMSGLCFVALKAIEEL